jgi:hypothetical protein
MIRRLLLITLCTLAPAGCVRRQLTITSDPPGALIQLNGQEFGRTPVTREFTWYGAYDVAVRLDGWQTIQTTDWVVAPWWQWPPFDLPAELLPVTDRQALHYKLAPATRASDRPEVLLGRAAQMRGMLRSTPNTRKPTTAPAP